MKKSEVISWFKSRCEGKTQDFYLKTDRELWQELQLENLFKSFDDDGSNSLDVRELHEMFQSNGVDITLNDCFELFKFVDKDGSGSLSINEFKLFLKS
jgi:Ca2+-binding EF-hand superfamily protein